MSKFRSALLYLFIFLLAALVLDLGNPLFDKPARDGGFFLYAGSQILSGKIPYVDFWDSKGPAIFYINALGLFLGQGSRWGVWGVEFVFVFAWLFILYKTILKQWQHGAAVFGITLAALGLRIVLGYGNYTEEYALLFNALALYLFFSVDENKGWKYFGIGLLFGISFSFRANNIGGLFGVLIAIALAGFVGNLAPRTLTTETLSHGDLMAFPRHLRASVVQKFFYTTSIRSCWLRRSAFAVGFVFPDPRRGMGDGLCFDHFQFLLRLGQKQGMAGYLRRFWAVWHVVGGMGRCFGVCADWVSGASQGGSA
ncbi:glycosyltransferase family 39 protein [Candidatus Villigracilis affinis]|uniref:glycosyltransferase family 39 protein n=1 Tax=Candidatus Villigracilis affinis TaxID=3140682 RepID=UPI001D20DED5|nr:glycosyltransferase family 39 protein [Anaerolineales bacterium]